MKALYPSKHWKLLVQRHVIAYQKTLSFRLHYIFSYALVS